MPSQSAKLNQSIQPLRSHAGNADESRSASHGVYDHLSGKLRADDEFFIRQAFVDNPERGCELLYRAYYRPLCSHATRFLYAREVAEDIVSDAFLAFWRNQSYQTITTSFRAYLFQAVRNRSIDYLRREFSRSGSADSEFDGLASPGYDQPDHLMQLDELIQQIHQTVHRLPPQAQRVFVMSRFEGKSGADIAAELQLNPKTVEGHITRALAGLRAVLRQDWLPMMLFPFLNWL